MERLDYHRLSSELMFRNSDNHIAMNYDALF